MPAITDDLAAERRVPGPHAGQDVADEVVHRIGVRGMVEAAQDGDAVAFGKGPPRLTRCDGERHDVHLAKADFAAQQFRFDRRMGEHDVGAPGRQDLDRGKVSAVPQQLGTSLDLRLAGKTKVMQVPDTV